ncbi:MAG: hypothetical protein NC123_10200 [Butyrivibrio sp.]|nr:hypothetical protein [Acetatifactor muris]MCM1559905.1 hypothetical protein [Butyrivibrio sp.]
MQLYQFEKIYAEMEKEYGKIRKGEEESHAMLLFTMEGNVLKVHRANPKSNSRRLREAIGIVLFDIKGRMTGENADTGRFRDEDNERLEKALLMSFDPFTNEELREVLGQINEEQLHEYYKEPVMCLLRIKDSVDTWEKRGGSDGYFDFIEQYMGAEINDDKMDFSAMIGRETSS